MLYRSQTAIAVLAVMVLAAPAAAPAPAEPAPPAERISLADPNSVVVFPFENAPESRNAPPMLGEAIAGRIRMGIDASPAYSAVSFYPTSPLVMRARGQGITPEDISMVIDPQRGVVDQERALRVAAAMGAASVVLGSVEDYSFNQQSNTASATVTLQFLQAPSGTAIKTVGFQESTSVPAGASPEMIAASLASRVATRALTDLSVPPPVPGAMQPMDSGRREEKPHRRGFLRRNAGWLALAGLVGVLAATVD
jgi:hypothetical protein